MSRFLFSYVLIFSLFLGGCGITATQTTRQLERGETVYSVSGELVKVGAGATTATGFGDVSIHGGTNLIFNYVGVGLRAYPSDWLNVGIQANTGALIFPDMWSETLMLLPVFWVTPRITTTTHSERSVYAGVQSNLIFVDGESLALFGGVFGFERFNARRGRGIQFEFIGSPIFYSPNMGGFETTGGEGAFFSFELRVVVHYSTLRDSSGSQRDGDRLEPTQESEPRPRERDEPERFFDDDDVPLY